MPLLVAKNPLPSALLPAWKRPFEEVDFRGYFTWTKKLSERLGGHLCHGCHEDELKVILDAGTLLLRSPWQLKLPQHGLWTVPGVWAGLDDWTDNHYGPALLKFPIHVLNGRTFMVFGRENLRDSNIRNRYYFVQYEARIPVYSTASNPWRPVDPADGIFLKLENKVYRRSRAIYDIVLTVALPLTDYQLTSARHSKCIPRKCHGTTAEESAEIVRRVAQAQMRETIRRCDEIQSLLEHIPCLVGQKMVLPRVRK
jgi:hypothetical protein